MATTPQRARRQQRIEELNAAAIRALTGDAGLHYRGGRLHRQARVLTFFAPHLRDDPAAEVMGDFAARRGVADAMALRLQHSDSELHRRLQPDTPVERLIFELLEQLRVESLVPVEMPGMAANLRYRFEQWSQLFHSSRLTETRLGLLMYTLAQSCWSRLNGRPPMAATEEIIETTRAKLVRPLGENMAGILRYRHDQAAYADYALAIARIVGSMVHEAESQQGHEREESEDTERWAGFALLLDDEQDQDGSSTPAASGVSAAPERAGSGDYRAFTTRYDREADAASLVRRELLRDYREWLDERIAAQGINLTRLSRELAVLLATPRRDDRRFGEEEGYIDGRRLAQLVSAPAERRVFWQDRLRPVTDCVVALLVDCSGSMKTVSEPVAMIVDLLGRALDRAGAATEVLGFTTGAWNGGRVYQEWLASSRPRHPGRLNEVLHMVLKRADQPWRRARTDIAALLKADLFREGIDGEALEWACDRLLARAEERRILIVISDGGPMDSATKLANGASYLDSHLREVVARQERGGAVEILAIGVGQDLSPFYHRCLAADLSQPVDNALFADIVQLISGGRRR